MQEAANAWLYGVDKYGDWMGEGSEYYTGQSGPKQKVVSG